MSKDKEIIISLFEPTERDMKLDYPELAQIEEFEELTARDLKFVWYVGNRTSPLATLKSGIRVKESYKLVYEGYNREKDLQAQLRKGEIPVKFKDAIARMSKFVPSVRLRAKLDTEYIFEAMQGLIFVSPSERANMEGEDKKDYQALLSKISKDLPDLVSKIENGYGTKIVYKDNRKAEIKVNIKDVLDEID
jgi:hypothetical protein